jgi:ABC-type transporter Mla subunit MlaD
MAEQQHRINQAAQQFTEALVQAFRTSADRTAASQEQGAQLTQEFFNRVTENLRTQAEDTRQMTQELAGQHKKRY